MVLDMLDTLDARATFFTTGVFAQNFPDLIQRAAAKHEVASRGMQHSAFARVSALRRGSCSKISREHALAVFDGADGTP